MNNNLRYKSEQAWNAKFAQKLASRTQFRPLTPSSVVTFYGNDENEVLSLQFYSFPSS